MEFMRVTTPMPIRKIHWKKPNSMIVLYRGRDNVRITDINPASIHLAEVQQLRQSTILDVIIAPLRENEEYGSKDRKRR
jgi:hypothetical protein